MVVYLYFPVNDEARIQLLEGGVRELAQGEVVRIRQDVIWRRHGF